MQITFVIIFTKSHAKCSFFLINLRST